MGILYVVVFEHICNLLVCIYHREPFLTVFTLVEHHRLLGSFKVSTSTFCGLLQGFELGRLVRVMMNFEFLLIIQIFIYGGFILKSICSGTW
jgi:hypothetical protein